MDHGELNALALNCFIYERDEDWSTLLNQTSKVKLMMYQKFGKQSDHATIDGICEDALMRCVNNYCGDKFGNFFSYYVTACSREMMTQVKRHPQDLQFAITRNSDHENMESPEDLIEDVTALDALRRVEEAIDLAVIKYKLSKELLEDEYDVCVFVLDSYDVPTVKEIASACKLQVAAVKEILESLQNVIKPILA